MGKLLRFLGETLLAFPKEPFKSRSNFAETKRYKELLPALEILVKVSTVLEETIRANRSNEALDENSPGKVGQPKALCFFSAGKDLSQGTESVSDRSFWRQAQTPARTS